MSVSRFGNANDAIIDELIDLNTPQNTKNSKKFIWKLFMDFCNSRKYVLDASQTLDGLAAILKDWAVNMRKKDGTAYKETTVKTIWNVTSKLMQERYYTEFNIIIDPFKSIVFKKAREARDAIRKKLQADPSKRKTSSLPLTTAELNKIITLWDENTPEGLQKKFYHIAAVELAWRGGEAVACLVDFFHIEKNNDGSPSGRVEYNPIFNKTCQGGSKSCVNSKWLIKNENDENACPVRLFLKMVSKRWKNVKTNRLFLRANKHWKTENDNWYDNMPLGKSVMNQWTKTSAAAIGLDVKEQKITNHSNRATAVSHLAKNGTQEQQLIKITGHSNASSIKPYLNIDEVHHNKIINNMRTNASSVVKTTSTELSTSSVMETTSSTASSTLNFSNCSFNNCSFNK